MTVRVGTSGWVYRDWRGPVYPDDIPQRSWLEHLSRRFSTIEINASFYRLPSRQTFERWAEQVPDGFLFAVKMSRYLTHVRRFRDPRASLALFCERAAGLGPALGPVLFQQPPTFRADLPLLRELLHALPAGMRAAFEFRHPTWHSDDVLEALDDAGAAWVLADRPGARVPLHVTGGWSYARFHRGTSTGHGYRSVKLRRWADRLASLDADPTFVYFNNDPGGAAVHDAERFRAMLDRRARRPPITPGTGPPRSTP